MKVISYFILIFLAFQLNGQDEHFSQFYAIPMHMNPALAGAYEGTYRMSAVYRDQWNNALGSPYSTFAIGGDTKINVKYGLKKSHDRIGVGLFFINDKVAEFQNNTNKLSTYFAYHKRLGDKKLSYLGAGIKFGIIQRNINYDNLTFGDQFDQINSYSGTTAEILPPNNFGNVDISMGLNYYLEGENSSFYAGAAYHHITKPNFSYFAGLDISNQAPNIDLSQRLNPKTVVHVSWDKELKYRLSLQPRLVYQKQDAQNQIDLGTNLEYTFKSANNALIFGLWATGISDLDGGHLENITPLLGIRQKQFIFGFSYDIHLRDLANSTFGFNSFEFSIRFSGAHNSTGAYCPTF